MKRTIALALLLAGCAAGPSTNEKKAAPDFELSSLDGTVVKGSSLWASKPVLLVFMTSW